MAARRHRRVLSCRSPTNQGRTRTGDRKIESTGRREIVRVQFLHPRLRPFDAEVTSRVRGWHGLVQAVCAAREIQDRPAFQVDGAGYRRNVGPRFPMPAAHRFCRTCATRAMQEVGSSGSAPEGHGVVATRGDEEPRSFSPRRGEGLRFTSAVTAISSDVPSPLRGGFPIQFHPTGCAPPAKGRLRCTRGDTPPPLRGVNYHEYHHP